MIIYFKHIHLLFFSTLISNIILSHLSDIKVINKFFLNDTLYKFCIYTENIIINNHSLSIVSSEGPSNTTLVSNFIMLSLILMHRKIILKLMVLPFKWDWEPLNAKPDMEEVFFLIIQH